MDDARAASRHFVILSGGDAPASGGMAPIARREDLLEKLGRANTAPESNELPDVLYGPGFRIELTPGQDPVTQMLVTITESEIGWQVLMRLLGRFQWKLVDPGTGRELAPSGYPPLDD